MKYEAAKFLIENLPFHYSLEGKALEGYRKRFELFGTGKYTVEEVQDSVNRQYGVFHSGFLEIKTDVNMDSYYLTENIEWAFKVWKEQPWGKNVSFENFCEYILPYRVGNETLLPWREKIYKMYNPMLDSIRKLPEAEDPLFVSRVMLDSLSKSPVYFTQMLSTDVSVGPKVVDWRSGSCMECADLVLYVFRALGIPCTKDMMLMRGDNNVAHGWNAVFDKSGASYYCSLMYTPQTAIAASNYVEPTGKVYRYTFSVNRAMVSAMGNKATERYFTFRYPCMVDVTSIYSGNKKHSFKINLEDMYTSPKKNEIIYLCSSRWLNWVPVDWCRLTDVAEFHTVEGGIVFRLATYDGDKLRLLTDPFLLDKEAGSIRFFTPGWEQEEICLLHKFHLFGEPFITRMSGGIFEGSNDAGFKKRDTLFVIQKDPVRLHNIISAHTGRTYRYVRYMGPKNSYCNVSEVAFYGLWTDSVPLTGKILGTPGCLSQDGKHEYTNVFDGDPYTSFDYLLPTGGWTGLDLGVPRAIGKIIFTPRNRDNFIRTGDRYELLYSVKEKWESAGMIIPSSDSLLFKVPKGALLYLKNHTRGLEERIFEYKDGKQMFW